MSLRGIHRTFGVCYANVMRWLRGKNGAVRVLVHRPVASDASLSVDVPLRYTGTAVTGVDYETLPTTVTIPAGAERGQIKVKTLSSGNQPTTLTSRSRGRRGLMAKPW